LIGVVVDLPGRMKLRGLEAERVSVILTERLAGCLPGAPEDTVLDLPETTVPVPVVTDCLLLTIGRVIRVVLGELRILFEVGVEDLGAIAVPVNLLVIVVAGRRVGVTVLFERVVGCLVVVVVDRLFTTTGRVMLVVLDELKVLFELVVGDLYVLAVERLLTLTDPRVVLGLTVVLRFVDEEFDDFGVGEAGREVLRLLEGARLGVYLVGVRLGVVLDGVRLGVLRVEERLGVVRLGVLLTEDRLGVVRLGVLLAVDPLEVVLPDDREVDLGVLRDVLRVETREGLEVDGALAAGLGVVVLDEIPATCL